MPSAARPRVAIHSGLLCEISYSHFTGDRVWTSVGRRKFGSRSNSFVLAIRVRASRRGRARSAASRARASPTSASVGEIELEPARRRVEAGPRHAVDDDADRRAVLADHGRVSSSASMRPRARRRSAALVRACCTRRPSTLKTPYLRMYCERRQALLRGGLRQAGHRVLEHPPVVLVHRDRLAGPIRATRSTCGCRASRRDRSSS